MTAHRIVLGISSATRLKESEARQLGWRTPAEALNDHLLLAAQQATVATTP
jgi:hypothetical protein